MRSFFTKLLFFMKTIHGDEGGGERDGGGRLGIGKGCFSMQDSLDS